MRNLIFFITITSIYIFSSCRECKNIDYCPLPVSAEEYFGAYTEGAYWIYYNQDSTKIDSVYLSNYETKREGDYTSACIEWDTKTFMLQSEFLSHIHIETKITNDGYCDRAVSRFKVTTTTGICLRFNTENTDFENCALNDDPILLKEFILKEDPNTRYENVILYNNRFWIAPEIGIVKYITPNNIDTFYLHKYEKF